MLNKTFITLKKLTIPMCLACLVFTTSCINMSSMQTGRTLEQGEIGHVTGGGYIDHKLEFEDEEVQEALGDASFALPYVDYGVRYGVTDEFDVGGKLTLIGSFMVDAKYQFIGDSRSDFAGSLGFGFGGLTIGDASVMDIKIPAYFSYHPGDQFALYATPRYTARVIDDYTSHWLGSAFGVRIGSDNAFILEYGYYGSTGEMSISQLAIGFAVGIP